MAGPMKFRSKAQFVNTLPAVEQNDVIKLSDLESALGKSYFQENVEAIQTDATTIPSLVTGKRYVITNKNDLDSGFGSIVGLGNNDIVQYDGTKFVVAFDASTTTNDYTTVLANYTPKQLWQYDRIGALWSRQLYTQQVGEGLVVPEGSSIMGVDFTIVVKKKSFIIGNGSQTDFLITHSLGNDEPDVVFKDTATNEKFFTSVEYTSENTITVSFDYAPATNSVKVEVIG